LDVATAPKEKGSPTLNMLKKAFSACLGGTNFELYGTDIALPYFKMAADGSVEYSDYVDPRTGKFREKTVLAGVRYFLALKPSYNALSDECFKAEHFDFISICMALHHLRLDGEKDKLMPLSTLNIISPEGERLNDKIKLLMAPSTQKAVDRLLSRLNIGGILFVNPFFASRPDQPEELAKKVKEQMHNNSDMFFIIRRETENTFTLFDRFPIPFQVKDCEYSPSKDWGMIGGRKESIGVYQKATEYLSPGIVSVHPGGTQGFYREIQGLLNRADLLVFRYQSWGKGIWGSALKAIEAIKGYKNLTEILEIYMENVPHDNQLKLELLKEAKDLIAKQG
jgi:hypothetical protein